MERSAWASLGSSKAAINLLTKTWAAEYVPSRVRVNAVSPRTYAHGRPDAMGEGLEQLAAQHRRAARLRADEIAEAVLFLATDRASFWTVQNSLSTKDALPIEACELAM